MLKLLFGQFSGILAVLEFYVMQKTGAYMMYCIIFIFAKSLLETNGKTIIIVKGQYGVSKLFCKNLPKLGKWKGGC